MGSKRAAKARASMGIKTIHEPDIRAAAVNRAALDQARGIAERTTHTSTRRRKFSELTGDVAAQNYVRRTYGNRIQAEIAVPRRGTKPLAVPILDGLFELDNGEFIVTESKAGESRFGTTKHGLQFSPQWFDARLKELAEVNPVLAARLEQAWDQRKITALAIFVPTQKFQHFEGRKHARVDVDLDPPRVEDRTKEWNAWRTERNAAMPPTISGPDGSGQGTGGPAAGRQGTGAPAAGGHGTYPDRLVESRGLPEGRVVGGISRPKVVFKARALAVGVRAWQAVRTAGRVLAVCFLPLTALDVVIEIAFALWDREHEKDEKKRQEKQKAIEAVFKQDESIPLPRLRYEKSEPEIRTNVQSLIQSKILNNWPLFDEHVRSWDNNRRSPGFLYARLSAEVHVETFHDQLGKPIESLTRYTVASLEIFSTDWAHEFELTDIGDQSEVEKTKSDILRVAEEGVIYPQIVRKIVARKRLKYTIVPPLFTPFDIVVTKINNLFWDLVLFVDAFGETGAQSNFTGFNYKNSYDEQFTTALNFPEPLNGPACRYCLSYLHWAAGILRQSQVVERDLQGNLEDPREGRRRRIRLLKMLLEKSESPQGMNFPVVAERMKALMKGGEKGEDVDSTLNDLFTGARAIWYDLERIELNLKDPQYYYLGPTYKGPEAD